MTQNTGRGQTEEKTVLIAEGLGAVLMNRLSGTIKPLNNGTTCIIL